MNVLNPLPRYCGSRASESLQKEIEGLRSKNAQFEADLQVSREQTAAAQELVNDWKGKLSQLISTS